MNKIDVIRNNLSEVVVFRRKELKVTQKELAEIINVESRTLRVFEKGGDIKLNNLIKILDHLEIRLIPIWKGQDKTDILKELEECPLEKLEV